MPRSEAKYTLVPCFDPRDWPQEVEDWMVENDISTHYATELHWIDTDEPNPFTEWAKTLGLTIPEHGMWIGVWGT